MSRQFAISSLCLRLPSNWTSFCNRPPSVSMKPAIQICFQYATQYIVECIVPLLFAIARCLYRGPRLASHLQLGKQNTSSASRITIISLTAFDRQNKTVFSNSYYLHFSHCIGVRPAKQNRPQQLTLCPFLSRQWGSLVK